MSSLFHLVYGFYIFSTALAGDLSQALNEIRFKSNVIAPVKEEGLIGSTNSDDLPPIVLVHGIFGFGKGVCYNLEFFPPNLASAFIILFLGDLWLNCFVYCLWVFRDWGGYRISRGRRRRMRGFWCRIWAH